MKEKLRRWYRRIVNRKINKSNLILCVLGAFIFVMIILKISRHNQEGFSLVERENQGSSFPEQVENIELIPGDLIRVLLKTDGYQQIVHAQLTVSSESGLSIIYGEQMEEVGAGEQYTVTGNDSRLQGGTIQIKPKEEGAKLAIHTLNRGYGTPLYYGGLEVYGAPGGVVIVNEVDLELYLRGVLPSEMPASYEREALKAQAVCARSYGYNYMKMYHYTEYEAHVDDSTSYQVYNNSSETEITNQAVQETCNQKLGYEGTVVTTYFFSTSCGYTTDVNAWGTEIDAQNSYLTSVHVGDEIQDYEKELPWYHWSITISKGDMQKILERNLEVKLGELKSVEITKKGSGNVALELSVVGSEGSTVVTTENKIRKALGGSEYQIVKQDGNRVKGTALLPSAFFDITYDGTNYVIDGGGYGHGIGMSQNGANQMAIRGMDYVKILQSFYTGTAIVE